MHIIDANIILRYVLNDHPELSPKARKIISEHKIETPIEVLCEVIFVLKSVYCIAQKDIVDTLLDFYKNTNCILPHREAVFKGLEYYSEKKLDFVDCILAGYAEIEKDEIFTFDDKLQKLLDKIKL